MVFPDGPCGSLRGSNANRRALLIANVVRNCWSLLLLEANDYSPKKENARFLRALWLSSIGHRWCDCPCIWLPGMECTMKHCANFGRQGGVLPHVEGIPLLRSQIQPKLTWQRSGHASSHIPPPSRARQAASSDKNRKLATQRVPS